MHWLSFPCSEHYTIPYYTPSDYSIMATHYGGGVSHLYLMLFEPFWTKFLIVVCKFIDDLSAAFFFFGENSLKLLLLPKLNPQSREDELSGIVKRTTIGS